MVGILIPVRLGSKRLPQKHLKQVLGKPILHYLIARLETQLHDLFAANEVKLFIATSTESENKGLQVLKHHNPHLTLFYGDSKNIPLRYLQLVNTFELDALICVDGDDIFYSPQACRTIYEQLKAGASFVKTEGYPIGMNAMGMSTAFLAEAVQKHPVSILETGWQRIFDESVCTVIQSPSYPDSLRYTLDYEADLKLMQAVIERFGQDIYKASDADIIQLTLQQGWDQWTVEAQAQYKQNFKKELDAELLKNQ